MADDLLRTILADDPTAPLSSPLPPPGQSVVTPETMPAEMAEAELMRRGYSMEQIDSLRSLGTEEAPIQDLGRYPFTDIMESAPEVVGATVGEIGGEAAGLPGMPFLGPIAPHVTGSIGAGLGGAAGAAATGDDPFNAFWRNFAASFGMRGALGAAKKVLRFGSRSVPEDRRESYDFMKSQAEKFGIGGKNAVISPRTIADSTAMEIMDNVGRNSFLGARYFTATDSIAQEVLEKSAEELADQVGKRLDVQQLVKLTDDSIKGKFDADQIVYRPLFNKLNATADERMVMTDMRPLKQLGRDFIDQAKKRGGFQLDSPDARAATKLAQLPDDMLASDALGLRSDLMKQVRDLSKDPSAPSAPFTRRASKEAFNRVDASLKDHPDLHQLWRQASGEKAKSEALKTKWIKGLIKGLDARTGGKPEQMIRTMFRPGNESGVRQLWKIVDQDTKDTLQNWYIRSWLARGVGPKGSIIGERLINNVEGPSGIGVKFLQQIFDDKPEVATNILKIGRAWKRSQATKGGVSTGGTLVQLAQGGAIVGWATGGLDDPTSAAIIIGPTALAKMMNSKRFSRWILEGLSVPKGSEKARMLASRLTAEAGRLEGERQNRLREMMAEHGPPNPRQAPRQDVSPAFSGSAF